MPWDGLAMIAGVRCADNDHVSEVGRSVKSHDKPKAAGASESERPEDAIKSDAERIDPVFLGFEEEVDETKDGREENCSRPESDRFGQRLQRVTAKHKLFRKPDGEHGNGPGDCIEDKRSEERR